MEKIFTNVPRWRAKFTFNHPVNIIPNILKWVMWWRTTDNKITYLTSVYTITWIGISINILCVSNRQWEQIKWSKYI